MTEHAMPAMSALAGAVVPVAATARSGFDECVHFGVAVALAPGGEVAWAAGDPSVPVFARSANKPLQADAMVGLGWQGSDAQVALACASHAGSAQHCDVVRSTLADAGLAESDLQNTADLPLDRRQADAVIARGGVRSSLYQNCSGKHAAMLATCVARGWERRHYLDPEHPLQAAITERIAALAGEVVHVGVDGCGAPTHVEPLVGLGRAMATLATQRGAIWRAMTEHPELVGGPTRRATALMRAVPGLIAKDGAEGVLVAAAPNGAAAAVKIADGGERSAGVVLVAALRHVGIECPDAVAEVAVLGHGRPVGGVRALVG